MKVILALCLCVSSLWALPNQTKLSPRIIGGSPAAAAQFPYAVSVHVESAQSTHSCGGALISNKHVLTSGSCVDGGTLFTLSFGSNKLVGTDVNRVLAATTMKYLHPEYNPLTLDNDIGLISLHLPIHFTTYIQPVSLPTIDVNDALNTIAIGWGQTSDDTPGDSNELNYVGVTVLSNAECRQVYGNAVTENMVCASGNYNEGTCLGDAGSPLLTILNRHNWVVAVNSFYSGNGCETTDPSGFTRVFPYLDWINSVINA